MSILSAWIHHKITDQQALSEAEAWVGNTSTQYVGIAWNFLHPFITALEPQAWAQAVPIIAQALLDVGSGNLVDLETSVLNKAEALGLSIFSTLDSNIIQALIAVVKAVSPGPAALIPAPAPVPTPAPPAA
jgi:hypothetical protein